MTAAVIERLRAARVVATLRAPSANAAIHACKVLVDCGVTALEITYTTPDVPDVLRALDHDYGSDILLGAGTVLDPASAWQAVEAGAKFLVSPGIDDEVVAAMRGSGATCIAGALTPTEVMRAVKLGVDIVKLFPGNLGGPGLLKALRGPFPDLHVIPTGGVTADNTKDWLAAGALAVGAASELCPAAALAQGDWAAIERAARAFMHAAAASEAAHG